MSAFFSNSIYTKSNFTKFTWDNYKKIYNFVRQMRDMNYISDEEIEEFIQILNFMVEHLFNPMNKDAKSLLVFLQKIKNVYIESKLFNKMQTQIDMHNLLEARKKLYLSMCRQIVLLMKHGDTLLKFSRDRRLDLPEEQAHLKSFQEEAARFDVAGDDYVVGMNKVIAKLEMGNVITEDKKFEESVQFLNYLDHDQTLANIGYLHALQCQILLYHRLKSLNNPIIEAGKDAIADAVEGCG